MPDNAAESPEPDDVDLDLDLEDASLREAIGQPTTIRISGKVLTFPHHAEWTHDQTRMMSLGMFDAWAEGLLSEADFKVWQGANLRNYQHDAIVKKMLANMGAGSPGKSQRPSTSPPRKRRR